MERKAKIKTPKKLQSMSQKAADCVNCKEKQSFYAIIMQNIFVQFMQIYAGALMLMKQMRKRT